MILIMIMLIGNDIQYYYLIRIIITAIIMFIIVIAVFLILIIIIKWRVNLLSVKLMSSINISEKHINYHI